MTQKHIRIPPPLSDLEILENWLRRIDAALSGDLLTFRTAWAVYRPDRAADSALVKLAATMPGLVQEIRNAVTECERLQRSRADEETVYDVVDFLKTRLAAALDVLRDKSGETKPKRRHYPGDSERARGKQKKLRLLNAIIRKRGGKVGKLADLKREMLTTYKIPISEASISRYLKELKLIADPARPATRAKGDRDAAYFSSYDLPDE